MGSKHTQQCVLLPVQRTSAGAWVDRGLTGDSKVPLVHN